MIRSVVKTLQTLAVAAFIFLSAYALMYGVHMLESGSRDYSRAYGALFIASAGFVLLPASFTLTSIKLYLKPIAIILYLGAIALQTHIALKIHATGTRWTISLVPLWASGLLLFSLAGWALDSRSEISKKNSIFQPVDWFLAAVIFLVSWYVRTLSSMSMAVDEGIHYSEMLLFNGHFGISPWGVTAAAYPWVLHKMIYLLTDFLSPLINTYQATKILVACMGGISVGAWFLIARIFASRSIALTTAILLMFFGWHWLNSRFAYLYPYDLAFVSLSILTALIALQYRRAGSAIIAGVMLLCALLLQKFGLFLLPFLGLVCFEYLVTAHRRTKMHVFGITLVIFATAFICYLPFLAASQGIVESPRFDELTRRKLGLLQKFNMTETQATVSMWKDAFWQFQVQMYDISRHVFRAKKPLLDPIFSGLFCVGLMGLLWNFFRQRESRLQLAGLLIFIGPMAVGFPLDSIEPHGLARRLLGTSFFCAWIAASGAAIISSRFVEPKRIGHLSILLACSSLLTNWYYLKTEYEKMPINTWVNDYGGRRGALVDLAQSLSRHGFPVIVLDDSASPVKDLKIVDKRHPFVTVDSIAAVRKILEDSKRLSVVIIPWYQLRASASAAATELGDLVPSYGWMLDRNTADTIPLYAYAYVWPREP